MAVRRKLSVHVARQHYRTGLPVPYTLLFLDDESTGAVARPDALSCFKQGSMSEDLGTDS